MGLPDAFAYCSTKVIQDKPFALAFASKAERQAIFRPFMVSKDALMWQSKNPSRKEVINLFAIETPLNEMNRLWKISFTL
jgi:hypothetical protein